MQWLEQLEKGIPARLRPYFTLRVLLGFGLCVLSLFIFGSLVDGVAENESIVVFDMALAKALHSAATPTSTSVFLFISLFGGTILFVWSAGVALILAWQRRWLAVIMWLLTIGGGQLLNTLLKAFFARPRPSFSDPLAVAQYYSFPSGHAMMSFIAYGMLAYVVVFMVRNPTVRLLVIFAASATIGLIGISRMTLGVHYFSDVIAGYAVGTLWLVTCIAAWRYVRQRRTPAEARASLH